MLFHCCATFHRATVNELCSGVTIFSRYRTKAVEQNGRWWYERVSIVMVVRNVAQRMPMEHKVRMLHGRWLQRGRLGGLFVRVLLLLLLLKMLISLLYGRVVA
uniref:Uncharacterized protein n=1 Tax=Anopheles christyi TaxID=43041 RepID=A0A182KJ42_9DIPT